MRWYKKQALSRNWSVFVQASSEDEVRNMHAMTCAKNRTEPYSIEIMPADFVPYAFTLPEVQESVPVPHLLSIKGLHLVKASRN